MSEKRQKKGRRAGRPKKSRAPALPIEEVDRLLVHGEMVATRDGKSETIVYPSYRELARRYQVSHSLIAKYSKDHNCLRRREETAAKMQAEVDRKLMKLRANAVAVSRDDSLRIIDSYLTGFEQAIAEGRVRFDNPADFNAMVRLKEFVLGGADSRQEIHASLSLEEIQSRHRQLIKNRGQKDPVVRGELTISATPVEISPEKPGDEKIPPAAPPDTGQRK